MFIHANVYTIGVVRNLTLAMEFLNKANGKHRDAGWHIANILMGQVCTYVAVAVVCVVCVCIICV